MRYFTAGTKTPFKQMSAVEVFSSGPDLGLCFWDCSERRVKASVMLVTCKEVIFSRFSSSQLRFLC